MEILISEAIQEKCPDLKLCLITCEINQTSTTPELLNRFEAEKLWVLETIGNGRASELPAIQVARKAYKACGKDPARYRVSSESLLRRVTLDKGLDSIGSVVDCLNIASMHYGLSIGAYDRTQIGDQLIFDIGRADDVYDAVGRGTLNIEGLPVLRDEQGAFGSSTTDSERAKIKGDTKSILLNLISFDGRWLDETKELLLTLLESFAEAQRGIVINISATAPYRLED